MQTVDNRGLSCPEPVIRTKRALDAMENGVLISIVDNQVAKENVLRLVQNLGLSAQVTEQADLYQIQITKGETNTAVSDECPRTEAKSRTVLLAQTDLLGTGDRQLGQVLMKSYFYALAESEELPHAIFFLNSGVNLTCRHSPVLDRLQRLQERGVQIHSCGTCLDYYHLQEQLAIGGVTNMYAIVESTLLADRTITLG